MEELYPRSGDDVVAVSRKRNIRKEDESPLSNSKKSKKAKNSLSIEERSILQGAPKRNFELETLSYDSISEGMLLLGRIIEIREAEIIVSLPGFTQGSVSANRVSKPYVAALNRLRGNSKDIGEVVVYPLDEMFCRGEAVIVAVVGIEKTGRTNILLSMQPQDIHKAWSTPFLTAGLLLTASVVSREEYGYILDTGMNGVSTFLPDMQARRMIEEENHGKVLGAGQLVQVKITKIKTHRLSAKLTVTTDLRQLKDAEISDELQLNYSLLLPGMLGDGIVMDAHRTGLKIYGFGMVCYAVQDHITDSSAYEVGSKVKIRVLYTQPNGNTPYVTLLQKFYPFCRAVSTSEFDPVGRIVNVKVQRIETRGLVVMIEGHRTRGLVPLNRLDDQPFHPDKLTEQIFTKNSKHQGRIIKYSAADQLYVMSLQKSILKEKYWSVDDLVAGERVKATVESWNSAGAAVFVGKIRGFMPMRFAGSGIRSRHSELYKPGTTFRGRIMKIDQYKNTFLITATKSILNSNGAVLWDWDEPEIGMQGHGTVVFVHSSGVFLQTIGGLKAYCPVSKILGTLDLYQPGTVVEYIIIDVDKSRKRLVVAFDMNLSESGRKSSNSIIPKSDIKAEPMTIEEEKEPPILVKATLDIPPGSFWMPYSSSRKAKTETTADDVQVDVQLKAKMLNGKSNGFNSVENFEKILRENPSDTQTWLRYIKFCLTMAEVELARTLARRALQAVDRTDTQSCMMIWLSLIRLEQEHGFKEDVQKVIEEAVFANEEKQIRLRSAKVLAENGNLKQAEINLNMVVKKYPTDLEAWTTYAAVLFNAGEQKRARLLLNRFIGQTQLVNEHVAAIVKFAVLEFSYGDTSCGLTMLNRVLEAHPKRFDVWSVTVDQLIKKGEIASARETFRKGADVSKSLFKAKSWFKKWLHFEESHGTKEQLESVLEKAKDILT